MEAFVQHIEQALLELKGKKPQERQALYHSLRQDLKEKIALEKLGEEQSAHYYQMLEKAIASKEVELAMLDKILIRQTEELVEANEQTTSIALETHELVNFVDKEKPNLTQNDEKNPILKFIFDTKKGFERAQRRKKLIKFWKVFFLIFVLFISLFSIFLAFFADKTIFSITEKRRPIFDQKNNDAQDFNKLTYRLLPDGTEIATHLQNPKDNVAPDFSKNKLEKPPLLQGDFAFYRIYPLHQAKSQPSLTNLMEAAKAQKNIVAWKLLRKSNTHSKEKTYKIEAMIRFPEAKTNLALSFYANSDPEINAKYLLELSFLFDNLTDAPKLTKILEFQALSNDQGLGAPKLQTAKPNFIGDNYFIYSFAGKAFSIKKDLLTINNSNYFVIKVLDQNNMVHEFVFDKGRKAEDIFEDAIEHWLAHDNKPL